MQISRRDFLRYCGISAGALGMSSLDLGLLSEASANPGAPTVIWLQGSGCTGCSVSFLNRISASAPQTAADVLITSINLAYHPNLMSAAGQTAAMVAQQAYNAGNYILVVEGGVPTALQGSPCFAWTVNGIDTTFHEAALQMASRAKKIVCVGNCACFGGVSAAPPNPTGVKGMRALTGLPTINIAGCPPHPDWIVWAIVQLLSGKSVSLDSYGRPTALYGMKLHENCPRKERDKAHSYGVDNYCLKELGCRGPETRANCYSQKWNGGANWCVDANAPCINCTHPQFPLMAVIGESHDGAA